MTPTAVALLGFAAWTILTVVFLGALRTSLVFGGKMKTNAFKATGEDLGSFGTVKEMQMKVPALSGAFGDGLSKMLQQASTFVTTNPTEFLLLKFDKRCSTKATHPSNYPLNVLCETF